MDKYRFYINGALILEPLNWNDIKFKILRDKKYFGLQRNVSLDKVKLFGNAITIIENGLNDLGLKAQFSFYIEELNLSTLQYEQFQTALIKLDTISRDFTMQDGDILEVDLIDNNFYDKITNREAINVKLGNSSTIEGEATSSESQIFTEVLFHSRGIQLDAEYQLTDDIDSLNDLQVNISAVTALNIQIIPLLNNELNNMVFSNQAVLSNIDTNYPIPFTSDNIILGESQYEYAGATCNYAVKFKSLFFDGYDADRTYKHTLNLAEFDFDGTTFTLSSNIVMKTSIVTYPQVTLPTPLTGHQLQINWIGSQTFTKKKDKVYLVYVGIEQTAIPLSSASVGAIYWKDGFSGGTPITAEGEFDIAFSMDEFIEAGNQKSMMIYEALQSTLEQITDTPLILESNIFGRPIHGYADYGKYSKIAITSGYFLRNAINSDSTDVSMEANFLDLFSTLSSLLGLAFWFDENDGKLHIEERATAFLSDENAIDLQEITNEISNQFIVSDVVVGNKNVAYENVNGANEFNTILEFNTPFNVKANKLNMVAKYNTDYLGIELARRVQFSTDANVDTKYDGLNFLVELKGVEDEWETRQGSDYESVFDIPIPLSAGNLLFSPKRSLLRNSDLINATYWLNQSEFLNFIKAANLAALTSKEFLEDLLIERDLVYATDMMQLFKPILWSGKVPEKDLKTILNSQGLFTFTNGCDTIKGWIWDAEIKEDLATIKILEKW